MSKLTADGDNIYDEHDDPVGLAFDNPALAKQFAAAPQLKAALEYIAFEPLTDDAEASHAQCLEEAIRIARAALQAANGGGE